jgi:hypothetical protein
MQNVNTLIFFFAFFNTAWNVKQHLEQFIKFPELVGKNKLLV